MTASPSDALVLFGVTVGLSETMFAETLLRHRCTEVAGNQGGDVGQD